MAAPVFLFLFIKWLFILSFAAIYDQSSIYFYTGEEAREREMHTVQAHRYHVADCSSCQTLKKKQWEVMPDVDFFSSFQRRCLLGSLASVWNTPGPH